MHMNENIPRGFEQYVEFKKSLSPDQRRTMALNAMVSGKFVGQELIGRLPVEEVLTPTERAIYEEEMSTPLAPRDAPHSEFVAITKLTRLCNLRCSYCHSWDEGPDQTMNWRTMVHVVRDVMSMNGLRRVQFAWHGGEVTLLKPKVMRKLIWLQQQLRVEGQHVSNNIQTNATALSEEWIDFLIGLDLQVGFSLDGPPEINDERRVDVNGDGTSEAILLGVSRLKAAGIPCGALVVIDQKVLEFGAVRLVEFALANQLDGVTLLNVLPGNNVPAGYRGDDYVPYSQYVSFLRDVFKVWWPKHRNDILFTDLAELMKGVTGKGRPGNCLWAGDCHGRFMTLEPTGHLAPCDKYRGDPGSTLGSITLQRTADIITKSQYIANAKRSAAEGSAQMSACSWFGVCRGGCPHDRMLSLRHIEGYDGSCCGLAPLLEDMRLATDAETGLHARPTAELSLSVV